MSYRLIAGLIGLTFVFAGAAGATEVERKIAVKGDPAAVWAKIGGWCAIADWHPVVAKCEEADEGGRKVRTLTTKDGGVIKEAMLKSGDTSYSYQILESPLPVENYSATFAAMSADGGVSVVWSAKFDPKGDEAEAKKVIESIFDGGLEQIKKSAQ